MFGDTDRVAEEAASLRLYPLLPERKSARSVGDAHENFYSKARSTFALRAHLRRVAIVILSAISRTYLPFLLMGLFNRVFPVFASVFFCYAGNKRYATHYSYRSCRRFLLWFPSVIGVFRQGQRWGLICAAPVTEAEFIDPKNTPNLGRLLRRLLCVKMLLGVNQMSFAGILPNVLRAKYPQEMVDDDRDLTSEVVRRAVHGLRRKHFGNRNHNVVLLGGAGRIGRAVHARLKADGIEPIVIDSAITTGAALKDVGSLSMILVDVSRHGVIQRYIHELPEGTVVLNEVFPEPSREAVTHLKTRNIMTYHIA